MHEISLILDVKGAAIEAYASLREIPTSACLRAAQSLAPSPHIHTICLWLYCNAYTNSDLF